MNDVSPNANTNAERNGAIRRPLRFWLDDSPIKYFPQNILYKCVLGPKGSEEGGRENGRVGQDRVG